MNKRASDALMTSGSHAGLAEPTAARRAPARAAGDGLESDQPTVRLYHYTDLYHLPSILTSQAIQMTCSGVHEKYLLQPDKWRLAMEPDVVWVYHTPNPLQGSELAAHHGRPLEVLDKRVVCLELEVPADEVETWSSYAARQDADPAWLSEFDAVADPSEWSVLTRPVPRDEWVRITCAVQARPQPLEVWRREDGLVGGQEAEDLVFRDWGNDLCPVQKLQACAAALGLVACLEGDVVTILGPAAEQFEARAGCGTKRCPWRSEALE